LKDYKTIKMQTIQDLISILETSVKINGADTPLTIGHLLNIVKMIEKKQIKRYEQEEKDYKECMKFAMGEHGQG